MSMKCDKGHDMQGIICNVRPASSEYYCEVCHQSKQMPLRDFEARTGRVVPRDSEE